MADLGIQTAGDTLDAKSGGSISWYRIGQMPSAGALQSVSVDCGDSSGAAPWAIAVATGTDEIPELLVDSTGTVNTSATHAFATYSGLSGDLASGEWVWVGLWKDPAGGFNPRFYTVGDAGGPDLELTTIADGSYPVFPGSIDVDGTFGAGALAAYITYGAGDTTAPSLTEGPTLTNVVSGGFDIGGTPDEGGTASLIYLSDVSADQPSDAAFDGSSETAAMTASTPFTIHHTGA